MEKGKRHVKQLCTPMSRRIRDGWSVAIGPSNAKLAELQLSRAGELFQESGTTPGRVGGWASNGGLETSGRAEGQASAPIERPSTICTIRSVTLHVEDQPWMLSGAIASFAMKIYSAKAPKVDKLTLLRRTREIVHSRVCTNRPDRPSG